MSEDFKVPNNEKLKRAICYVPFGAVVMLIAEKDDLGIKKDIKY